MERVVYMLNELLKILVAWQKPWKVQFFIQVTMLRNHAFEL